MKLRTKLALSLGLGVTFILLCCFSLAYLLVERDEMRDLDAELAELSQQLRSDTEAATLTTDESWKSLDSRPLLFVALYGLGGELVRTNQAFRIDAPRTLLPHGAPYLDMSLKGNAPLRMLATESAQGTMVVALSKGPMLQDMRFLRNVLGGLLCAGVCGALLLAWFASRDVSRDVAHIAATARNVTTGALSSRVSRETLGSAETQALARDLNQMIEDLERIIRAQKMFVSHAAHELRSPLATLRGELQLCLRKERSPEDYRRTLETVHGQTQELSTLAEALLSLARASEQATSTQTFQAQTLVEKAMESARGNAEERAVRFEVTHRAPRETAMMGNVADVARALRNMLDNAIAHSEPGGIVGLEVDARAGEALFTVEDDGEGVAAADIPHIFVPFWRGQSEQGAQTGAGLGLTIAREIAHAHGGTITLEPPVRRRGARFVLSLPVHPTPAPTAASLD